MLHHHYYYYCYFVLDTGTKDRIPYSFYFQVHILPRDLFGTSTFALSIWLLKWFPVKLVDYILILCSHLILGDTCRLGLDRPKRGPLELKSATGKTPVLDAGAIAKIRYINTDAWVWECA